MPKNNILLMERLTCKNDQMVPSLNVTSSKMCYISLLVSVIF